MVRKILRWAGYGLGGLVTVVAVAAGGAFAASEVIVRAPVAKPATRLVAATGPEAVARGHRIAVVQGCTDCHGADLKGRMFDDIPKVATLYAPNLTLAVARQSDADLDRAIRHGVGSDGRPLWAMPSSTFAHLTDAETADLVAYLRSFSPQGAPQPRYQLKALGRIGVLAGKFTSEPAKIKANAVPALPDFGPRYAAGREVARACVECHGPALKGATGVLATPDLTIAGAYDPEDFQRLMHAGKAAGNREVGLMSRVARYRFASFSVPEVNALHDYLKARAEWLVAESETRALPNS